MWQWLKNLFSSEVNQEIKHPNIIITVKWNELTKQDDVYIKCDWPDMPTERVYDIFSKLLYAVQIGNLYEIFNFALLDRCKKEKNSIELYNQILAQIKTYTLQNENLLPSNTEGILIYPSEVFKINEQDK